MFRLIQTFKHYAAQIRATVAAPTTTSVRVFTDSIIYASGCGSPNRCPSTVAISRLHSLGLGPNPSTSLPHPIHALERRPGTRPKVIHSPDVTSDLVPLIKIARSWPRRTGYGEPYRLTPNSFVLKILTSKLFGIKILQTIYAGPAPSKTLRRYGGGGYPGFRLVRRQNVPLWEGRPNFISGRNQQPDSRWVAFRFLRRRAKTVAEWRHWSWSSGGCVCPAERPV
jgi:hypothetical protein